ncbi:MAG: Gfo/Idh/MocA family oxidoreductase [Anaerolineaceae bacterium]|nr:Gfo/Idh/MocA family oxidoreductase [Anaerolineaceae bacterium]
MKTLIAGFGSIGRRHLNNLRALGEKDILLYRTHHSTLTEEGIADIPVETTIEGALAHHPDAVIVANPTALHMEVALPAAEAGCAVMLEKPISHSFARVEELSRIAAASGSQILVGFQFRYHPILRQIDQWLKSGAIGTPVSARAHWGEYLPAWHPWEDFRKSYSARADLGGGVVNTLTHPIDYLHWLLGEAEGLTAMTGSASELHLEVEDTAEIVLRYQNGAIGSIHLDYVQRPPQHTLEIVGNSGSITWDNSTGAARLYRAETQAWQEVQPPQGFERNQLFLDEMAHFIRVARHEESPVCTLQDGVAALKITSAVYQSMKEARFIQL